MGTAQIKKPSRDAGEDQPFDYIAVQGPKRSHWVTRTTGLQGPIGPQGPTGPQGATGSVDTTNFYTKSQSDGRFLGVNATAVNSNQLNGLGSSAFLQAGSAALSSDERRSPLSTGMASASMRKGSWRSR